MADNRKNAKGLVDALHEAGLINLDAKISDLTKVLEASDDPGEGDTALLLWDGYAVVVKGLPAGVDELRRLAGPANT